MNDTRRYGGPSPNFALHLLAVSLTACASALFVGCNSSGPAGASIAPVITWLPPAAITYGTPLSSAQLDATANVAGSFTYSPAAGTVPVAGMTQLSVTFVPLDPGTYKSASATVSLTINKGTPTITWPAPAPITTTTALSAAQLDATANTPGSFVYIPGVGAVEPLGTDTLSVTFTPTDTTDYTTATSSVPITVTNVPVNTVALDTLAFIQQMINLDTLAEFPTGVTAGMSDSKDPRAYGPNATYFDGDVDGGNFHGDVTLNGITQHIMLSVNGPGVVTRLFVGGPNFAGHNIRYYIDGSTTPAIMADVNQLLTCATAYATAPLCYTSGIPVTPAIVPYGATSGQDLYLPIPFAKSIMVTYDGPTGTTYPIMDYVLEYKLFPAGTNIVSYSLAEYQGTMTAVNAALAQLTPIGQTGPSAPPSPLVDAAALSVFNAAIPAGGSANIPLTAGANAVRFLKTNVGTSAATLKGLQISLTFDGEQTVSAVPFGQFFGSGDGTNGSGASGINAGTTMTQSVTSDGTLISRWTMPYQTSASITINNTTAAAVTVPLTADVRSYPWSTATSMHFHAVSRTNGVLAPTNNQVQRFLYVNGAGVYVGDNETVYQYQDAGDTTYNYYGEGDELFYVDSDNLANYPSIRGTGTEDYFGYAYGNTALFQVPWASNVADPSQIANETQGVYNGTTVLNRTRLVDTIPFAKHLRFDFEIDDHDQTTTDHLLFEHTSFFYALPGLAAVLDGPVSGQNYSLQNKISGWNMDSSGGTMHTQVLGLDRAQTFTLVQNAAGLWTIKDLATGMYVGLSSTTAAAGSPLVLGAATGTCNQLWSITANGENNGYNVITNSCNQQVMDLYYGLETPNTTIQQYYANGTDAQYWRFALVPAN